MNQAQTLARYAKFLRKVQTEISELSLSPDDGSVSRGDLIAQLMWIAARIAKLQAEALTDRYYPRPNQNYTDDC